MYIFLRKLHPTVPKLNVSLVRFHVFLGRLVPFDLHSTPGVIHRRTLTTLRAQSISTLVISQIAVMGKTNSCTCSQNSTVNLVCPLDIQGSCDTSIWGDLNANHLSSTNVGLMNWSWSNHISGCSFILGLIVGLAISYGISYYRQRRTKKN